MCMKNINFLLRYSNRLANGTDTLTEHRTIIKKYGCVWLGKFGIGMSYHFAELAKNQIDNKIPCFLYLMNGAKLSAKSNVIDLAAASSSRGELLTREPNLTPLYYRDKKCSVWFKLNTMEEISSQEAISLRLYNNPALPPSTAGMRGLIYLTHIDQSIEVNQKTEQLKPSIYTEGLFD